MWPPQLTSIVLLLLPGKEFVWRSTVRKEKNLKPEPSLKVVFLKLNMRVSHLGILTCRLTFRRSRVRRETAFLMRPR